VYKSGSSIAASGSYESRPSGFAAWEPGSWGLLNTYEMVTDDHVGWSSGKGDCGGPFLLIKKTVTVSPAQVSDSRFRGSFYVSTPTGFIGINPYPQKSNTELDAMGTHAIATVEPTNPSSNLLVSLGELKKDGIPSIGGHQLWKERTNLARGAGSEYLNSEFGWKPLVRDIKRFAKTVMDSHRIIEQYRKDSDRKIRRRYNYPFASSSQSDKAGSFVPIPASVGAFGSGSIFVSCSSEQWFSGAFRYHIPIGVTTAEKLQRHYAYAQKLFGINPSPENIWNLAPWSWSADWFSNTGDVLHNISALGHDGLVMEYGYMMSRTLRREVASATWYGGTSFETSSSRDQTDEFLLRRDSTPYGFGTDLNNLTAAQASVLVALGLSRS